jgi:hypothetical protein
MITARKLWRCKCFLNSLFKFVLFIWPQVLEERGVDEAWISVTLSTSWVTCNCSPRYLVNCSYRILNLNDKHLVVALKV